MWYRILYLNPDYLQGPRGRSDMKNISGTSRLQQVFLNAVTYYSDFGATNRGDRNALVLISSPDFRETSDIQHPSCPSPMLIPVGIVLSFRFATAHCARSLPPGGGVGNTCLPTAPLRSTTRRITFHIRVTESRVLIQVRLRGDHRHHPQHLHPPIKCTHSTRITTFSHIMILNVFALGASKNIGYHAALRLLSQ